MIGLIKISGMLPELFCTTIQISHSGVFGFLEALIVAPPTDGQLFASNFTASNIAWCLVAAYDLLYEDFAVSVRTSAEELLMPCGTLLL